MHARKIAKMKARRQVFLTGQLAATALVFAVTGLVVVRAITSTGTSHTDAVSVDGRQTAAARIGEYSSPTWHPTEMWQSPAFRVIRPVSLALKPATSQRFSKIEQ